MHIRGVAVLPFVFVLACSSADDEPPCAVAGTYTLTTELESGACELDDPSKATAQSQGGASTITVSSRQDSAGSFYVIEASGLQGGCAAQPAGQCQLQAKCDIQILDALDPNNRMGTFQYSWTFTRTGFTGLNTISLPPANNLSKGCASTLRATGTRR
jgi:hypothetical protein